MKTRIGTALWICVVVAFLTGSTAAFPPWGLSLEYLDPGTPPGTDFFRHSNGGWLKTASIPADRQHAGVNLELNKGNETKLKSIVAELLAAPDEKLSAESRKLRDLYSAFVDTAAIEAAGLTQAQPELARIASLQTAADVAAYMAAPTHGSHGPFELDIQIDEKNPQAYVIRLYQSGLGMPDRDYYLRDDKNLAATRDAYKKYLADTLALAGIHDAARAAAIYALESKLADAHWPAEDRRDAEKTYNPMTMPELDRFAPAFPWAAYLQSAGVPLTSPSGPRKVVLGENSAFPKLAEVFAATPVPVWRDYLTVRYFHANANLLPKQVDDVDFAFYGTTVGGQKQQLPRDTRGLHLLDNYLGEALGKLYCDRYFPPEAKAKAKQLVTNLLKAYESDIRSLSWMTPATRAKALEKLKTFMPKIGYPDNWRDYSALGITRSNLVGDIQNARDFEWHRELARLDGRVDRTEWEMSPPTNNAYYNPTLNEIVFPAGILQPPYFDANADDAVNYGEIGATIGHEISHGFDDQGSKYDASGRLNSWWTEEDRKVFDARTAQLASQYNQFEALPGLHVNGKLTLGENIADLAGMVIALKAYHIALAGKPAPVLNGFTGDQRFYLAYGQSWRELWTDGRTRRAVLSNEHSPSAMRVNGVVRNDDAWYAAFPQVKPGDALYLAPAERVRLW